MDIDLDLVAAGAKANMLAHGTLSPTLLVWLDGDPTPAILLLDSMPDSTYRQAAFFTLGGRVRRRFATAGAIDGVVLAAEAWKAQYTHSLGATSPVLPGDARDRAETLCIIALDGPGLHRQRMLNYLILRYGATVDLVLAHEPNTTVWLMDQDLLHLVVAGFKAEGAS